MNKPVYKLGSRVKLVDNDAGSSFEIGTVGKIVEVRPIYSGGTLLEDIYLIENEEGFSSSTGTWSYARDLTLIDPKMPRNTKTL